MNRAAITGKTENHLCKRNTCLLRFTKLSTLANIVLQDSNYSWDEKMKIQSTWLDKKGSVEWRGQLLH